LNIEGTCGTTLRMTSSNFSPIETGRVPRRKRIK
jgi:hypothetical protein